MSLRLRCGWPPEGYLLNIVDYSGTPESKFDLMVNAILDDVTPGAVKSFLECIRRVEMQEELAVEADGNAWITHITPEKVWFEGLYSQGSGGAVTLVQYKFAIENYARFLADPDRRSLEVPFPDG